ncbi:MAG TPA: redoxin domain-containing protein [Acidimicrobiales bacterium]|nr:redoxin domain-containing protein [Acidimicrobiales bacterium]
MTATDDLLKNAKGYASSFDKQDRPMPPGKKVAVLACMDARLNVYGVLGLTEGDAHVIRNAGGVVTDDAIRSLTISQRLLGTEEIILIHHTDCGMLPTRPIYPNNKTAFNERSTEMGLSINETAPDFEADTTEGRIKFHDWIGDSWAVLFSHPKDFTPVCTTELGYMAKLQPEFERRGVKIIGLSVDATKDHEAWANDIEETQGARPNYPIIGDADFNVSKLYGMLPASTSGDAKTRTPADNQTVRNVFIIGPDKKVKLVLVYPMTTGRNFDEVLRVIDSLQLTAKHRVSTPVNWKQGEDVIIAGSVSNEEAKTIFGTWKESKPYIRIVPQPS